MSKESVQSDITDGNSVAPEGADPTAAEPEAEPAPKKTRPETGTLTPAISTARPTARPRIMEAGLLVGGLAAVGIALFVGTGPTETKKTSKNQAKSSGQSGKSTDTVTPRIAYKMPTCTGGQQTASKEQLGDPRARRAAQRGLDYLASAAKEWQSHNNCYGCHVQAVTVEALSVGIHNQYSVARADTQEVLRGMLDLTGGARQPGGLNHSSRTIGQTGKLLGGAAFARYDQWVDASLRDYMLTEAQAILEMSDSSGQVAMPWVSAPVATGPIQATAHAIVTWKQAYERTADDQWLTAISRAEDWLHGKVATWKETPPSSMQDMNYAMIGLLGAGVSNAEVALQRLATELGRRQNSDGGFPLHQGGPSSPFATGQTLYALRLMGRSDSDPTVARGTAWLIEHQQENGSWSSSGFGKAEAMWAVLGLVSVDVLSVTVEGLKHGQHVTGLQDLAATARDNKGAGVAQIEMFVDDIRAYGACGAELAHKLDTSGWQAGKHVVEVRATNTRGQVSRRFYDVYAGDVYLTQIGTRYNGSATEISLRNILEADLQSNVRVEVEIYEATDKDGEVVPGAKVHTMSSTGRQGAMSFAWDGTGAGASAQSGQKYVARLSMEDDKGKTLQSEDVVFVHDTLKAQRDNWAQLEGQLALPDGDRAQNAEVELVDEIGRVVARTKSTKAGSFRFRNVKSKKGYKVRVKKDGFAAEAPAAADLGEDNNVDLQLIAE